MIFDNAAPLEYYEKKESQAQLKAKSIKKNLLVLSFLRISVFVLTAYLLYLAYPNFQFVLPIALIGIILFVFLLKRYSSYKRDYNFNIKLKELCELEINIAQGNFLSRPDGSEFKNPQHFFSDDIDLFGHGSFFQYLNRTSLIEGRGVLADLLLSNNTSNINDKQKAIKELQGLPDWRLDFAASASLIKAKTPSNIIVEWVKSYQPFVKNQRHLPIIFGALSILILTLVVLDFVNSILILYWILIGLFITGLKVRKVNDLSANAEKAQATIRQYSILFKKIEDSSFKSQILKDQGILLGSSNKASKQFHRFSRALDHLDNRNNLIYALLGNGFFLTDLWHSYKIEKWILDNQNEVEKWFNVISHFDAMNSLGNFSFNHPSFTFPKMKEGKIVIRTLQLGHPLLTEKERVLNDVSIHNEEFFIITGANMAGKSTFLRTVSLYIVMANLGLPVCAKESIYSPIKLITSMRSSDSLTTKSSYFFSELSRLKFIIDSISSESYFIILDEILKGTNSIDKALGSKKFVERLVHNNATGLIATHDLSICKTAEYLEEVENYYFDAQIVDDQLYFDYKLKKGICKNMNASFLLKKMDIV